MDQDEAGEAEPVGLEATVPAVDGPPSAAASRSKDPVPSGAQFLLPGFVDLMERTQREAFDLHQEARRVLADARDEAAQIRAAAASEASLTRDRALAESEWLRRDTDRLWATFSRFLAAATELVSVLGPLASARSGSPVNDSMPAGVERGPASAAEQPADNPPPTTASEADLLAAEQELRGMLDKTRQYFRPS